jgi:hypothetical protein
MAKHEAQPTAEMALNSRAMAKPVPSAPPPQEWPRQASSTAPDFQPPGDRWTRITALIAHGASRISQSWASHLGQALAAIEIICSGPYLLHYPRQIPIKRTAWQRFME